MSDGKKYFVLMEDRKDTSQVFASKQPCGVALKAATRGHTTIRLRERAPSVSTFSRAAFRWLDKPAGGLVWLPDKIKKANVKKQGIEHLECWTLFLLPTHRVAHGLPCQGTLKPNTFLLPSLTMN